MASWVTHLMIADRVVETFPDLCRHEFLVGNLAPDCNIENEDGTGYTPSREVTHWMSGKRKTANDSERFLHEYMEKRELTDRREESFLLGYYAHLIADAEFQRFVRDERRVADVWSRIRQHPQLKKEASGMEETWDSVKRLISLEDRMRDIFAIEKEYLDAHPESGYLTDIMNLTEFPDYLDFLPEGAIVRKIKLLRYLPREEERRYPDIGLTKAEYDGYAASAVELVTGAIGRYRGRNV